MYPCPCCGCYTLDREADGAICPVCFWEDDPIQLEDPDLEGGANQVSLRRARRNYREFGACEERAILFVRYPLPGEEPKA